MTSQKINFGIDLGTTNSALVKFDQGNIIILKSELQKDTTPSCVSYTKKGGIRVGESALNGFKSDLRLALRKSESPATNTFVEFKRTMGTDKDYYSPNTGQYYSSEELSAEILKKLRTYADGDPVDAAIITVPAKFRQNQLEATQRAANLAGFRYVELLQEPIAASIAYGLESSRLNGFWLVFDFGGGTFDAALMKVDKGMMKVIDTEGDNHLGGKDIDYAIVDEILLPYIKREYSIDNLEEDMLRKTILRDALKSHAEEAKIQLSYKERYEVLTDEPICLDDEGEEIEIDLELSLAQFNAVAEPIYRRSMDIVSTILGRNGIKGDQLETIILVGGATYTKLIREMLVKEVCPRIDTTIDPMIAVAKGAALFAATRNLPPDLVEVSRDKIRTELIYSETTTELEIKAGLKIENWANIRSFEFIRSDGGWSSGSLPLKEGKAITSIALNQDVANIFRIRLIRTDGQFAEAFPDNFTVMQGMIIASATLPYSICIDTYNSRRKCDLLTVLPGLEKNQQLPAKGKAVFYTPGIIQPGDEKSRIDISIYEGDPDTRAIYNEPIGQVFITGKDIEGFLPANQEVELTLLIDSSRRMKLSAYFQYIDETIEIKLPEIKQKEYKPEKIEEEINSAKNQLAILSTESKSFDPVKLKKMNTELQALQHLLNNARGDYNTKTQIVERLRDVCIAIDALIYEQKWPKMEAALREAFEGMDELVAHHGEDKHRIMLQQYKKMANQIVLQKDILLAQEIILRVNSLTGEIKGRDPELWSKIAEDFSTNFNAYAWSDRAEAKRLVEMAKQYVHERNMSDLTYVVRELFKLLPDEPLSVTDGIRGDKLIY
jgi:molecular chaperone DnaK